MPIVKAEKRQKNLKMCIAGQPNAGKTLTSLIFARALAGPEGKIGVIDTENGASHLYADRFEFFVNCLGVDPHRPGKMLLNPFSPDRYKVAMEEFAEFGIDVLIIDSLTHAYTGDGGLQQINESFKRGNDSWSAWIKGTPIWNSLIHQILLFPAHVICSVRMKIETVKVDDSKGNPRIETVGVGPILRPETEYDFDFWCSMDRGHTLWLEKTRYDAVDGFIQTNPDATLILQIKEWLEQGAPGVLPEEEQVIIDETALELTQFFQQVRSAFPLWCANHRNWQARFTRHALGLQNQTHIALPKMTKEHLPQLQQHLTRMKSKNVQ